MNYDVKTNVDEYLDSHKVMTLATVTSEGKPMAHTVDYVKVCGVLYFMTEKTTRKAGNIRNNPHVFFTVDEDLSDIPTCRAIQMAGTASMVTDAGEARNAMQKMVEKIPQLAQLPPNPDMVVFKIIPKEGHFIDNNISLGFRAEIKY